MVGIIAMGEKISCGVATPNWRLNNDVRNMIKIYLRVHIAIEATQKFEKFDEEVFITGAPSELIGTFKFMKHTSHVRRKRVFFK